MSEITKEMNAVASSGRTFVLPVTAATRYQPVDMTHMPEMSGSPAIHLELPLLTAEQKEAAVMDLARKVAVANGRVAPATIPAAFTNLLDFAGSTPHNLVFVMGGLGDYLWRVSDGWRKGMAILILLCLLGLHPLMIVSFSLRRLGCRLLLLSCVTACLSIAWGPFRKLYSSADLDTRLANFGDCQMPAVLKVVRECCLDGICWDSVLGGYGAEVRKKCYLKLLSQNLTDVPVRRSNYVLGSPTASTFGDFEGAGVCYCETDVSIVACLGSLYSCLQD